MSEIGLLKYQAGGTLKHQYSVLYLSGIEVHYSLALWYEVHYSFYVRIFIVSFIKGSIIIIETKRYKQIQEY